MPKGGARPGAGRPRGAVTERAREIVQIAREHAPAAFQRLVELSIHAQAESVRKDALGMILDRAYGRCSQAIELAGADGGPIKFAHEDALARLR